MKRITAYDAFDSFSNHSDSDASLPDCNLAFATEVSKLEPANLTDEVDLVGDVKSTTEIPWLVAQRQYYQELNTAINRSLEEKFTEWEKYPGSDDDSKSPTYSQRTVGMATTKEPAHRTATDIVHQHQATGHCTMEEEEDDERSTAGKDRPQPTCPQRTCPQPTCPQRTCPEHTCPQPTCPQPTCPQPTCPQRTCPEHTCPQHTCPQPTPAELRRLDKQSLDRESLDRESLDRESLDRESLDRESLDRQSMDRESQDRESLDRESLDRESLDRESLDRERLAIVRDDLRLSSDDSTGAIEDGYDRKRSYSSSCHRDTRTTDTEDKENSPHFRHKHIHRSQFEMPANDKDIHVDKHFRRQHSHDKNSTETKDSCRSHKNRSHSSHRTVHRDSSSHNKLRDSSLDKPRGSSHAKHDGSHRDSRSLSQDSHHRHKGSHHGHRSHHHKSHKHHKHSRHSSKYKHKSSTSQHRSSEESGKHTPSKHCDRYFTPKHRSKSKEKQSKVLRHQHSYTVETSRCRSMETQSPLSPKRRLSLQDADAEDTKRRKLALEPDAKNKIPLALKRLMSCSGSSSDDDDDDDDDDDAAANCNSPSPCKIQKRLPGVQLLTRQMAHKLSEICCCVRSNNNNKTPSSSSSSSQRRLHHHYHHHHYHHHHHRHHRTIWDRSIYDPEYSDSEASRGEGVASLEMLEMAKRNQPVVALAKLAMGRNDVVLLKNLSKLQRSLSGLALSRSVSGGSCSSSSKGGCSPPARHFLDVLHPSSGSSSPRSVTSPLVTRRNSESSEKAAASAFSFTSSSFLSARRDSEASEDKGSSPPPPFLLPQTLRMKSDSAEREYEASTSHRLLASSQPTHGPHNLRRLPRVTTTISQHPLCLQPLPLPLPPLLPIATSVSKDDNTGRYSRIILPAALLSKPRVPALFSVPTVCPVLPVSESDQATVVSTVSSQAAMSAKVARRVDEFSCNQEEFVYASLDESSWTYKVHGVRAVGEMLTSGSSPSVTLLKQLLKLLLTAPTRRYARQVHDVLLTVLQQHPPFTDLAFTWDHLSQAVEQWMENVTLEGNDEDDDDDSDNDSDDDDDDGSSSSSQPSPRVAVYRGALALQYMVCALEADLLQRSLNSQHQLNRSLLFRWFCYNGALHRVRQLILWLVHTLRLISVAGSIHVFSLLDQLLDLALAVHHRPEELATHCVVHLSESYLSLHTIQQKRALLCLSSPLLVLKLCRRVLEDHCSADIVVTETTAYTLEDLLPAYFSACPPRSSLSAADDDLPLTPADTEADSPPPSPDAPPRVPLLAPWSPESCEELALLLWAVVRSYVEHKRYRLHLPVPLRLKEIGERGGATGGRGACAGVAMTSTEAFVTQQQQQQQLADCDRAMLKRLPEFIEYLTYNMKCRCGGSAGASGNEELTPRTHLYLAKLATVCVL